MSGILQYSAVQWADMGANRLWTYPDLMYRGYSIEICYGSTAAKAKARLQAIIHKDREACGDGRWVCDFRPDLYWKITFKCQSIKAAVHGNAHIAKALWSAQKDRYRWEPRR